MKSTNYMRSTGLLFLVIAFVHLLRIINQWPAEIGGWMAPMWLSWVVIIVGGYLGWQGLRRSR